ncbi:uncharacterized protein BO66DRAFT_404439 [Aspergillus aculeatinus CBS 121060]|uniref:Uncharacterized protein n=1 Tax=Aspergillus aculeatinus CBS 121060 TaxID=1448322 RepID=A0ACD1H0C4_9EURO|nr:hypothetical protein BO66DRAFT_404439 [Aspergillus aculeatinus CBS 121060]RAH66876.1 hypothetical protein BO66DRAFT_404439 [Aspergillus aculeatinus CBS 121060]
MPVANICDDCWVKKLELMQQSPYSAYSAPYETMLNYSISVAVCNLQGVETQPTSGGIQIPVANVSCSTGNWYTVQPEDTCDSIALAQSISSSTLYQINPTLYNCSDPTLGLRLCLPLACENVYEIAAGDNCSSITAATGTSWLKLVSYNGMVDSGCSNIGDTALLGGVRCVSAPGGTFNLTVSANSSSTSGADGQGGSGSGYGTNFVALPSDITLADGTTTDCGDYYTIVSGDTCVSLLAEANTPFNLFMAADPSITSALACDDELTVGLTYCIHPIRGFNATNISGNLTVSTNGLCGNGTTCLGSSFGDCCSLSGYCGSTSDYCAAELCDSTSGNCVSGNPISLDGLCASLSSTNATCTGSQFGSCCSTGGYCGNTSDYCGYETCQSAFGSCVEAPPVSSDGLCGALSSSNATCTGSTFGDRCSINGYCGSTSAYCAYNSCLSAFGTCDAGPTVSADGLCGAPSSSNATCAGSTSGDCCSINGYCGSTEEYCGIGSCDSSYGNCDTVTVSLD